ncbi:G-type lectin S-receptor-like serine/threonine-protein kinase, partial [Actinidia chinensis var. chinensis]
MGFRSVVFLLIFLLYFVSGERKVQLGQSLLPTTPPTLWSSSSGLFAFGFYQQDNGFKVGIWLIPSKKVVWTANRDDPPVTGNSTIELTREGKLVLRTEQGGEQLIANASGSAASMLNSGNFVLYNKTSEIIWQTFDYPTDTILGGQTLSIGMSLISSLSDTDHSTGQYILTMQGDGNLVSYPLNTEGTSADAYWASGIVRPNPCSLYLNSTGSLAIINNSNSYTLEILYNYSTSVFNTSKTLIYRATLDSDGVFNFYCHTFTRSDESSISVDWSRPTNPCEVKGFCGLNRFCTFDDDQPSCRCLPGTNLIDPNLISLGCGRNSSREGCRGGVENTTYFNIGTMEKMSWGDVPYYVDKLMSLEDCKKSCLEDCNCEAAQYVGSSCKKYSLPLKYVRRDLSASSSTTALLKVGTRSIKSDTGTVPQPVVVKSKTAVMLI